jgi:hypothetical protein
MSKRKSSIRADATRIQRAVIGFQIPMMQITALYKHLETAIENGATDPELVEACRAFLHP